MYARLSTQSLLRFHILPENILFESEDDSSYLNTSSLRLLCDRNVMTNRQHTASKSAGQVEAVSRTFHGTK